MSTLIKNRTVNPFPLPHPMVGVLSPGQGIVVSATQAQVEAVLGPSSPELQVTTVQQTGNFDDAQFLGQLLTPGIDASEIDADAVGASELADDAVDTAAIQDDAVTTPKIADDAVTNDKLADDAVDTAQLADSAVDANRLATDSVTTAKLAADSVTGAKVDVSQFNTEVVAGQDETSDTTIPVAGLVAGDDVVSFLVFDPAGPSFSARDRTDFTAGAGELTVGANAVDNTGHEYIIIWQDKTP